MLAQYPLPKRNTVSPNRFLPPAKDSSILKASLPPAVFLPFRRVNAAASRTLLMVQKNSPTTVFPVDTPPRIPYKFLHATRE